MRLLIISSGLEMYSIRRLRKAAEAVLWEVDLANQADIRVVFDGGVRVTIKDRDLREYDRVVVRFSRRKTAEFYSEVLKMMINLVGEDRFLNGKSIINYGVFSKATQAFVLSRAGVSCVPTHYSYQSLPDSFPVVMKDILENNGTRVRKVENRGEARKIVEEWGEGKVLVQELIEKECDYRVLVLGGKVLGYMKKMSINGSFITNIHGGGKPEVVEDEIKPILDNLAVMAVRAYELDWAGVDVIVDSRGKAYVLEVNPTPGFMGFEKVNQVNVGQKIVNFLEDGYEK